MSKPAAGNYYIINRVLSPAGKDLSITFKGQNQYATVTALSDSDQNQVWVIRDAGAATQSISPASNPNLQVGWGSSGAMVLPPGGYVWTIAQVAVDTYTIQDGGRTAFWGVTNATENEGIKIVAGNANDWRNQWVLVRAS
ncbi:hypothetical protein D9756_010311 [Leucocoprinus leucothites]|uniref:CCL2-like lectin domain-containing protein n=1 Tax=Leucocoprinus leucothites TaxID=201217 RepID=A0A8H5FT63_9AGAR|nr:hypothetical protein D9756_010311 [Leucoagaricus leucothites]